MKINLNFVLLDKEKHFSFIKNREERTFKIRYGSKRNIWCERNIGKMEIDRYVSVVSIPTHKKNYSTQQQRTTKNERTKHLKIKSIDYFNLFFSIIIIIKFIYIQYILVYYLSLGLLISTFRISIISIGCRVFFHWLNI